MNTYIIHIWWDRIRVRVRVREWHCGREWKQDVRYMTIQEHPKLLYILWAYRRQIRLYCYHLLSWWIRNWMGQFFLWLLPLLLKSSSSLCVSVLLSYHRSGRVELCTTWYITCIVQGAKLNNQARSSLMRASLKRVQVRERRMKEEKNYKKENQIYRIYMHMSLCSFKAFYLSLFYFLRKFGIPWYIILLALRLAWHKNSVKMTIFRNKYNHRIVLNFFLLFTCLFINTFLLESFKYSLNTVKMQILWCYISIKFVFWNNIVIVSIVHKHQAFVEVYTCLNTSN